MRSASTSAACWWCPTTARSAGALERLGVALRPQPLRHRPLRGHGGGGPRRLARRRTSPTTWPASSPRSACRRPTVSAPTTRWSTSSARPCGASRCRARGTRCGRWRTAGVRLGDHLEQRRHRRGPPRAPRVGAGRRRARACRWRWSPTPGVVGRRQARRARVPGDHRRPRASRRPHPARRRQRRSTTSPAPPRSACRPCTWIRSGSATATTRTSSALADAARC